jgi:hypothetical protein
MNKKRATAPSKGKRKPSEIEIKLGDLDLLADVLLPDNLDDALENVARLTTKQDKWKCDDMREQLRLFYYNVFVVLLNEQMHSPVGGPRGPKLPAGVKFFHLLPHLSEAKRVLAAKEVSFEAWCESHEWPGGMKVKGRAARNWLKRYAPQIEEYELSHKTIHKTLTDM